MTNGMMIAIVAVQSARRITAALSHWVSRNWMLRAASGATSARAIRTNPWRFASVSMVVVSR